MARRSGPLRGTGDGRHFAHPTSEPNPEPPNEMEPAAILTFVLIAGFVWGGFVLILGIAMRKERDKEMTE